MINLTLVAPGFLSSPQTFSSFQLPTCISHHRPYFLSSAPSLTNYQGLVRPSFLQIPSSFVLSAVTGKAEFGFPLDNIIHVEAKMGFSLVFQGLIRWLCKQQGICKQNIKGNKGKYNFRVKEK